MDADIDAIRERYHDLAERWKLVDTEDGRNKQYLLNNIFTTLKDPVRRQMYDDQLQRQGLAGERNKQRKDAVSTFSGAEAQKMFKSMYGTEPVILNEQSTVDVSTILAPRFPPKRVKMPRISEYNDSWITIEWPDDAIEEGPYIQPTDESMYTLVLQEADTKSMPIQCNLKKRKARISTLKPGRPYKIFVIPYNQAGSAPPSESLDIDWPYTPGGTPYGPTTVPAATPVSSQPVTSNPTNNVAKSKPTPEATAGASSTIPATATDKVIKQAPIVKPASATVNEQAPTPAAKAVPAATVVKPAPVTSAAASQPPVTTVESGNPVKAGGSKSGSDDEGLSAKEKKKKREREKKKDARRETQRNVYASLASAMAAKDLVSLEIALGLVKQHGFGAGDVSDATKNNLEFNKLCVDATTIVEMRKHDSVTVDELCDVLSTAIVNVQAGLDYDAEACQRMRDAVMSAEWGLQDKSLLQTGPSLLRDLDAVLKGESIDRYTGGGKPSVPPAPVASTGSPAPVASTGSPDPSKHVDDATEGDGGIRTCNNCGNPGKKRCSRCRMVSYCCRDCQENDWKAHKKVCATLKSQNDREASGPHQELPLEDGNKKKHKKSAVKAMDNIESELRSESDTRGPDLDGDTWPCEKCTYQNPVNEPRCSMCQIGVRPAMTGWSKVEKVQKKKPDSRSQRTDVGEPDRAEPSDDEPDVVDAPKQGVCQHFLRGHCQLGSRCRYAHVRPDESSHPKNRKKEACVYFLRGACSYGDKCSFRHESPPPPSSQAAVPPAAPVIARGGGDFSALMAAGIIKSA